MVNSAFAALFVRPSRQHCASTCALEKYHPLCTVNGYGKGLVSFCFHTTLSRHNKQQHLTAACNPPRVRARQIYQAMYVCMYLTEYIVPLSIPSKHPDHLYGVALEKIDTLVYILQCCSRTT